MTTITDAQIAHALTVSETGVRGTQGEYTKYLIESANPVSGYVAVLRELRDLRAHVARLQVTLPLDALLAHANTLQENNGGRGSWMTDSIRTYVQQCRAWAADHPTE